MTDKVTTEWSRRLQNWSFFFLLYLLIIMVKLIILYYFFFSIYFKLRNTMIPLKTLRLCVLYRFQSPTVVSTAIRLCIVFTSVGLIIRLNPPPPPIINNISLLIIHYYHCYCPVLKTSRRSECNSTMNVGVHPAHDYVRRNW